MYGDIPRLRWEEGDGGATDPSRVAHVFGQHVAQHRPLLIAGAMRDWPALPSTAEEPHGWDLRTEAGRARFVRGLRVRGDALHVEVAEGKAGTAAEFYGDDRFAPDSTFLLHADQFMDLLERALNKKEKDEDAIHDEEEDAEEDEDDEDEEGKEKRARGSKTDCVYLNQCPLYPLPGQQTIPIPSDGCEGSLLDDIRLPGFLLPHLRSSSSSCSSLESSIPFPTTEEGRAQLQALHSANLWVSVGGTASNMHYDCFHGLLCIVQGSKRVLLHPPDHTRRLRVCPVYGKATNHSQLSVTECLEQQRKDFVSPPEEIVVRAGEMLFIPEGWYHQVTSPASLDDDDKGIVIAVNIWWKSEFERLVELARSQPDVGMETYYMRRLMEMLVQKELRRSMEKTQSLGEYRHAHRKRKRQTEDEGEQPNMEELLSLPAEQMAQELVKKGGDVLNLFFRWMASRGPLEIMSCLDVMMDSSSDAFVQLLTDMSNEQAYTLITRLQEPLPKEKERLEAEERRNLWWDRCASIVDSKLGHRGAFARLMMSKERAMRQDTFCRVISHALG